MSCEEVRLSLGAHVLDTLDAAEAAAVRRHVATCPACRAEYDELAPLGLLLATVTLEQAEQGPVRPGTALLDQLMARVAAARRRARRRRRLVAAAAALVAVVAGVAWGVGTGGDEGQPSASLASPTGWHTVSATDAGTGVRVTVRFAATPWGTALDVTLRGVASGQRCRLVVVGRDGERQIAASWAVPPGGYDRPAGFRVPGAVALPTQAVDRFEVVTLDGRPLARVRA
jgi:predicted anti-sigma-YlaC factor YlaD